MSDTVRFAQPPVIELIFGVQFSPLSRITTAHLGWFWKELGAEWIDLADGPALSDQFERFDQPAQQPPSSNFEWRVGRSASRNRVSIGNQFKDRLLQIQTSQLRFHWRQSHEQYPSYDRLIGEFEGHFDRFARFVESNELGKILPNQWDLTYINAFPRGEGWNHPEDWKKVLPGLFGVPPVADGLTLDSRSASWSYIIPPEVGRLHITAGSQVLPDTSGEVLLLRSTARGPIRGDATQFRAIQPQIDRGHDAILKTFLQITSPQMQTNWGRIS